MQTKGAAVAAVLIAGLATPAIADGYDKQFRYSTAQTADGVDWSGIYAGVHTGGVSGKTTFMRQNASSTNSAAACPVLGNPGCNGYVGAINTYRGAEIGTNRTVDIEGYHIGPHVGYQKQFGHMVYGADLGFSIGGGEGKKDCSNAALNGSGVSALCESEYKYSLNARGRVGYATGNYLFYGTAGLVRAKIENTVTFTAPGFSLKENGNAYPNGYLLGLGMEYQAANGMRFGLGYTHIILEKVTVNVTDGFGGGSGRRDKNDPDVLGGALRIPLQQQAPAVQDPGPPAAQAPAIAAGPVAPPAAAPAAARPAAARPAPAAAPAGAPAVAIPGAPVPTLPPAAATPVPGQPMDPADPVVKGKPSK